MASLAALDWLQRHYWTAQAHALSKTDDALRTHLKAYKRALERSAASLTPAAAAAKAARDAAVAISVNQGDTILLSEAGVHASGGSMPDRAQEALRALFSALASGNTLQHTRTVVEGKLVPMLLSDMFMLKPPKQRYVQASRAVTVFVICGLDFFCFFSLLLSLAFCLFFFPFSFTHLVGRDVIFL